MNTAFDGYAPYKGDIQYRKQGSLIAFETGESVTYGLFSAQERGTLFIGAGEKVYSGMVIGENAKTDDIEVNVCKTKHLTNTRSSSADDALRLTPPTESSVWSRQSTSSIQMNFWRLLRNHSVFVKRFWILR